MSRKNLKYHISSSKHWFGFTIVEILVVISIMGILVAISMPAFSNYERNARVRHSARELRSLFWEAQALSLSPSDVVISSYSIHLVDGSDDTIDISLKDSTGIVTKIFNLRKTIRIEDIVLTTSTGTRSLNEVDISFLTGNRQGGSMSFSEDGSVLTVVIASDPDISRLQYKVVLDRARNSITYEKT